MSHDAKILPRADKPNIMQHKYARVLLVLAIGATLLALNGISGQFGELGKDSDDLMRFMQIRDYLHGQSWFDTDQHRMGLTALGTDMHWSRIPDIPIILLTHLFDIFMSQDAALDLAISVWPPLSAMIVFSAILIGADNMHFDGNRKYLRVFAGLLAAIFVASNFRFKSGAIDHHNLQFGFVALSMALAMDRDMRVSRYGLSGLAIAISLAIGPEVYLFAAVICAFIALNWVIKGARAARGTQGFGLGLAAGLSVIFVGTVAPENYGLIYCDALSLITLTAGIFGGLGLAAIVQAGRYYGADKSYLRRFIALAVLGAICLATLSFQAPQCLSNPLDSLPPEVIDLWLNHVAEAVPLYQLQPDWPMFLPMALGPVIVALLASAHSYYKRIERDGFNVQLWGTDALILMLLLTSLGLTIYQVRFWPFTYLFSILILSRLVANSYSQGLMKTGSNIKYILYLAMAIPILWAIPGAPFVADDTGQSNSSETSGDEMVEVDCGSDEIMAVFNSLPTGLVAANSNSAGHILIHTPHRVVSGNYHRNWAGISVEMKLSIASPQEARSLLTEHKFDYLYFCKAKGLKRFIDYNPDGLTARLQSGNIPDFLVPLHVAPLENGDALILKVKAAP